MEPNVSGKPVGRLSLLATLVVLRQVIGTNMGSRAHRSFWGVFAPTYVILGMFVFSGQLTSQLSKANKSSFIGWYRD